MKAIRIHTFGDPEVMQLEEIPDLQPDADQVVVIGNRGPGNQGTVSINPRAAMGRDASIMGMSLANASAEERVRLHAALVAGLANGSLRPVIGQEFPLAEAAKAHHTLMETRAYGKIVLIP